MAKSSKPSDEPRKRTPADAPRPAKKKAPAPDEDDEDEDEEDDGPAAGPKKPRKKRKSATNPWRLVTYIGGGLLGAIGLVFFFYWVYSPVGADPKLVCYCPPDTYWVEGLDVEEMQKNSKMKDIFERAVQRFKFGQERKWKSAEFTEKDVQYYLACQVSADWEKEKDYDAQDRRGRLTMLRFKEPINQTKFLATFADPTDADIIAVPPIDLNARRQKFFKEEKASRDGTKKYYRLYTLSNLRNSRFEPEYDDSFFFPNNRTLIISTTRREIEEAMERTPGKIELDETMRALVDSTDGHYFKAMKDVTIQNTAFDTYRAPSLMSSGFVDETLRNPETRMTISIGSASWVASDGNNFLTGDGTLMIDKATAKRIYASTAESVRDMKRRFFQEDAKAGDKENPFFAPKPPPGAGGMMGGGGEDSKKKEDIAEAMTDYYKKCRVDRRGNMVYVEGRIAHDLFGKMWTHIAEQMLPLPRSGFGGMGGGGMMPGMAPPGMAPPGMAPPMPAK